MHSYNFKHSPSSKQSVESRIKIGFLGLITITLLYYDFILIQPYITPIFWAFMICIFLRGPRNSSVHTLNKFVPPIDRPVAKNKDHDDPDNAFNKKLKSIATARVALHNSRKASDTKPPGSFMMVWLAFVDVVISPLSQLWIRFKFILNALKESVIIYYFPFQCFMVTFVLLSLYSLFFIDYTVFLVILLVPLVITLIFILLLLLFDVRTLVSFGLITVFILTAVGIGLIFLVGCSKEIQFITTQVQEYLVSIKDNIQGYGNLSSSLSLSPDELNEYIVKSKFFLRQWFNNTFIESSIANENPALIDIGTRVLHYVEELDMRNALKKLSTNSSSSSFYSLISDNVGNSFQSYYQVFEFLVNTLKDYGFATLYSFFSTLVILIQASISQVVAIITFFIILFLMLHSNEDVLDLLIEIIPGKHIQEDVRMKSKKYVNGIFVSTISIGCIHGLLTYIMCYFLRFNIIFLTTLISAFLAIFPVIAYYWLFVPYGISMYRQGNYTEFCAVALVMGILFVADGIIMDRYFGLHDKKKGLKHNPFVTGFSIVLGIYAFGWNGFVIGPLLVFLTVVAYDLFLDHYVSPVDLETRNAVGELIS